MSWAFQDIFSTRPRLPVIMSAELAECGLACIAMIATFHGHDVDLNGLRQRFPFSSAGTNLRGLIGVTDALGLSSRALTVEVETLGYLKTPAILHWDFVHFVVLERVTADGRIAIHDPMRGAQTLSRDEFSKHFTGVALELEPAKDFERITARIPFRLNHLWSKSRGLTSSILQVLGLSAALQLVTFLVPFQIQLVVDQAINNLDANLLLVLCLGFGALFLLQAVLNALRSWAIVVLSNVFIFQAVGNLVRHLLRLPGEYFEKRHVGDILSRISSTDAIQEAFTQGIISAILDGTMALAALAIMLVYSPLLTAIVAVALAANFAVSLGFFPAMKARTEQQLNARGKEQTLLMESVRAATVIKLMGREAEREGHWRNLYSRVINATASVARFQTVMTLIQDVLTATQTVLVVGLGAKMILDGQGFSVGMLLAFLSFRQTLTDRATSLVTQTVKFRLIGLHLSRIADIATARAEYRGVEFRSVEARGGIELRDVSFRYGVADPFVVKDVTLEIRPGDFVAITGPSGGGKTTLLKLLLGLLQPATGEILLDGENLSADGWRGWRARVGVVMQDDRLFSGSIADNIAFFDPDLDMARVIEAAAAARVHADIERLPMRYSSLIGDMGSALSGGQKQRILLARALYRKPSILFLDEGTANLDEDAEREICDLVDSLPITRVVIAHRPALVRRASRVFVVKDRALREVAAAPRPAAVPYPIQAAEDAPRPAR
jgi:ATP-binding cassette subfamily B protein RaxB